MAQKRMFDRAIIDTDRFMDLSMSSKALYFLLGMEADDEGFVSYKKVMRIHGGNEDHIKVLIAKNFIIAFQSGVVVITDWNSNNYLNENRIKPTEYQKEKAQLRLTDNKKYEFNQCLTSIEESSIEENRGVESIGNKLHNKNSFSHEGAKIIKAFEEIDPKNKTFYSNKTQRAACDFLIKEYTLEAVLEIIPLLREINTRDLYIPQITSPYELKLNWVKLWNAKKKFNNKPIIL